MMIIKPNAFIVCRVVCIKRRAIGDTPNNALSVLFENMKQYVRCFSSNRERCHFT